MSKEEIVAKVYEGVVNRDQELVVAAVKEGVAAGLDPIYVVENGLTKGMEVVAERFEKEEYFLPDLLLASACVQASMEVLKPLMTSGTGKEATFVIGTVEGDIHDIGKNLVATTLEATGFKVIDLGVSVPASEFVNAVKKYNPDLVGISALITATMVNMKDVLKALEEAGVRDKVKVIVGGAPINQQFADAIGADYYGRTVRDAVVVAKAIKEGK